MTERKKPSSSWFRLSSERRELDVGPLLVGAMDLLRARMAECGGEPDKMGVVWQQAFAADVRRIVTGSWDAGAAEAAGLRSALDAEQQIRKALTQRLRVLGQPVPTDPLPSDPPPAPPAEAPTRPRTSSAIRIQQWGLVELWLAENDARGVVIRAPAAGLNLTVIDPVQGERQEDVAPDEDPSRTALRAIGRMDD